MKTTKRAITITVLISATLVYDSGRAARQTGCWASLGTSLPTALGHSGSLTLGRGLLPSNLSRSENTFQTLIISLGAWGLQHPLTPITRRTDAQGRTQLEANSRWSPSHFSQDVQWLTESSGGLENRL